MLAVTDNGRGFPRPDAAESSSPTAPSLGLAGMRERIAALDGSVEVRSLEQGASVIVRVPVLA